MYLKRKPGYRPDAGRSPRYRASFLNPPTGNWAQLIGFIMPLRASALPLVLALALPIHAEELPVFIGDDIVVTPTRAAQKLSDTFASTTVITRKEIEQSPSMTLPEILADYAGVGMQDLFGNNAASSTVDIRGFGASAGQNTLVLVDGRRMNDIDLSGVVWSAIPLSAIERVEIVRGGSSVLHGSGAVGGVINIITRSPVGKPAQAGFGTRAGSDAMRDVQVYGNLGNDTAGLTLATNHYESDGYRDNNRNEQDSFYGDARWKLDQGELILKFGADRQDMRLPGARLVQASIGLNELADDPEGTSTPQDWASRDGWQLGLTGSFKLGTHDAIIDLAYRNKAQESYFDYGYGYSIYPKTDLDMLTLSPRMKFNFDTGTVQHGLMVGVDLAHWDYTLDTSNAPSNIGQPINHVVATQRNAGLYMNDQMRLTPDLSLAAGARLEQFSIDASDKYDATAPGASIYDPLPAGSAKQDTHEYAWEFGMRYRLGAGQSVFGKTGRSLRFATVDEIYEYAPSYAREFQFLKPQTAHDLQLGWEAGSAKQGGRATLYYARVKDEIHLDPYSTGVGNTNLPPLQRYGLELEARAGWGPVHLSGAYTLAYAKFTGGGYNDVALDGNTVPLVPRHKLSANAAWQISPSVRLLTSANYVSDQYMDNDEPNSLGKKIPAYTVVDTRLEYRAGGWTLAAAANNLFDEAYYTYAVRSAFTPDRYAAYPLPGRHFRLELSYAPK
jgi:iron complex outermembrane recepter protein